MMERENTKRDLFSEIKAGLEEAISISRGEADPATYRVHNFSAVDVRAIRKKTRLSQEAFARKFGFTVARLRDWEQGRSAPDSALSAYLTVIDKNPKAVEQALAS